MKKLFAAVAFFSQMVYATNNTTKLDGTYAMKLKIGDKIFNDIVTLKPETEPSIRVLLYNSGIIGEVTVPGSFTSPLKGQALCDVFMKMCDLNFEITANENGESFKVFYSGSLIDAEYVQVLNEEIKPHFSGTAKFEDGTLLGTFTAERVD